MDLTPCEIDILFDASEDYTALWEAKWECGRQAGNVPEDQLISQGRDALGRLVAFGLISLYRDPMGADFAEIVSTEANSILTCNQYWQLPPHDDAVSIYFAATDEGLIVLREDEQIKAYYRSKEFLARYPDPEWHPMKKRQNASDC